MKNTSTTSTGRLYESQRDGCWYVARVRTTAAGSRVAEQILVMDLHEVASHFAKAPAIARARAIERGLIDGSSE